MAADRFAFRSDAKIAQLLVSVVVCCIGGMSAEYVKHVHMVFMNHLDVGYDGLLPEELGFVNNILNKYFHEYFPRAIQVAATLEGLGYYEKLIYTTHPWLVSLYMECPPNFVLSDIPLICPNATEMDAFLKAVNKGVITWHAGPMNMQMETLDPSLASFGLKMSRDLDVMFNITRKHRTLSQRDVPAMTQAVIPLLVKEGIEAVSVGVNTVTAPPAVPPIFRWQFKNSSVIGLWHPGGYPDNPGPYPFFPKGLSRKDCATFPGFDHALCFGFRTDNSGPPVDIKEVLNYYEIARAQFPGADVQASTFEDFIASLQPIKDKLPVVDKEFGDTWIQGTGSDPRKVAEMRALMRVRADCLEHSGCSLTDARMRNSSRFLLKLSEHTWGLSSVFDRIHWSNTEFFKELMKGNQNFVNGVLSWQEQRNFSYIGIDALGSHSLAQTMKAELSKINAVQPDLSAYDQVKNMLDVQTCQNGFVLQFSKHGYIQKLTHSGKSKLFNWASPEHPIGKFIYQTLNQSDFDFFNAHYPYCKNFDLGIGKFNMSRNVNTSSQMWPTELVSLFKAKGSDCKYLLHIEVIDKRTMVDYGAPAVIYIEYDAAVIKGKPGISIDLQWFKKQPTRLPEAIYFSFEPLPQKDSKWMLYKLGQTIDPLNVIQNGSQRLHIVDRGVRYMDSKMTGMEIVSPDVGLVNILTSKDYVSTIPLPLEPISDITGVAYNLYNNIWDVNFIFWYPFEMRDTDQKFRFYINFNSVH